MCKRKERKVKGYGEEGVKGCRNIEREMNDWKMEHNDRETEIRGRKKLEGNERNQERCRGFRVKK